MEIPYSRIYAEINLDHIEDNIKSIKENMPEGTKIIAVLKADGYGHGAVPAARVVDPYVWGYATAALEEAVNLREHGFEKPILVLGSIPKCQEQAILEYDIRPTIFELSRAERLSKMAMLAGKRIAVHIAVDTGMSRIGYRPDAESAREAALISRLPGIIVEGLFTHFSRADETDRSITEKQFESYRDFAAELERLGVNIPVKHCSNSAAIIDHAHMSLDAVRAGIAMYGLYPSEEVGKQSTVLKPAMSLYSFVTYVKDIEPGTPVSYGGTFVAERKMRIATVSAGYGDGYPRNLSGKGQVLVRGRRAQILGRICMDQFMIDVSGIPFVEEDDRVTLLGRDGEETITMENLADTGGGFHYEIPCVIGKRVPRVYVRRECVVGTKDYHTDRYEKFSMELLQIEHGTHADLDAIEQLYNDLNDALEAGINYPGWKKGVYPIREDAAAGIEQHNLFVARLGNKIVGSVILNHIPEKGYSSAKWQYDGDYRSVFVVHTLAVHPAFMKSGVGTQLMKFAESIGLQNNIKAIRLDVYEKNIPAVLLYERCGYRYIKTVDLGLGDYGLKWFKLYEKLL